ncbi:hypothetical protein [Nonlabens agnitus]|uniref:Uncharacterized protein n=1 Tax=Nonlabens agnitus TaxID=870484 RepID=A0A2S9WS64_9FLAO|nr:hypothetical protein [Nonlabens agnitus]PRP66299.1 hypothetical protein BST86_03935 [Nonlabens agnitus]
MNPAKFKIIILINLIVFAFGNGLIFLVFQDASRFELLEVVLVSSIYTVVHIFLCLTMSIVYRIILYDSPVGRAWFWSTIMLSVLGLGYYVMLTLLA